MQNSIIDTKSHKLSLANVEYELTMTLGESYIEFKLVPKKDIPEFYYQAEFDLSSINQYLRAKFEDLKKAFIIYDKQLKDKKVKLIKLREDSINLNLIRIDDFDEKFETNLELKQFRISSGDVNPILSNKLKEMNNKILELEKKLNEMKKEKLENKGNEENKKIESVIEDYLKKKEIEEEIKKQKEEELLREKEEKRIKSNDINLLNDFQFDKNKILKPFDYFYINGLDLKSKSVAVYSIIRNNKRFYELACGKREYINNNCNYHILIYDILLNKITNKKSNAHYDDIYNLKHYYYSKENKHFLLSSCNKSIKLWNISSNEITIELTINNNYKDNQYYYCFSYSCLLFDNENFFIVCGGSNKIKTPIFDKDGNQFNTINDSSLERIYYIEAAYIENKPYILLSGNTHIESYDFNSKNFNNGSLKKYTPSIVYENNNSSYSSSKEIKVKESYSCICNLFKNNKMIYLISGQSDGRVLIFDFDSTVEIHSFKADGYGGNPIYGLCPLNEKYFLVGKGQTIQLIDFDNKSIIESYITLYPDTYMYGIEKINIPEKGELIISYSGGIIFWK